MRTPHATLHPSPMQTTDEAAQHWTPAAAAEHTHSGEQQASARLSVSHAPHCSSSSRSGVTSMQQTTLQLGARYSRPTRPRDPTDCGWPPTPTPVLWRLLPMLSVLLLACTLPLLAAQANFTEGAMIPLLSDSFAPDSIATNSSSDGENSFDTATPYFVPPEPVFNGTNSNSSAPEYVIPVAARNGIWSYQCCNECSAECSGRVVHRVCLNRTTLELLPAFSCSLIPAIPVSAYADWAASNCSLNNCPTWEPPLTYNTSEQACGRAFAFPNSRCMLNGTVVPNYSCYPQERPQPVLMNQSETCSPYEPSLGMLKFQQHTANGQFDPRQFFDMAALNGVLYLVGGLTSTSVQSADAVVDVWQSADLGVSWSRVDVLSSGFTTVQDHTLEVIGSSLIAIGGMQRGLPSINVWRSDDGGRRWSISGHLLSGRAQHDSVPFLNGIVIAGGWSLGAVTSDVFFTTDGAHFYLQTLAAPWSARTYPRLAVSYDTLLICGGWLQSGRAARDLWKSKDAVQWSLVTAATPFSARVGYVFFSQYRELVLMGGISQGGSTYYTDQWSSGDMGLTWNQRQAHAYTRPDGTVDVSASFSARAWPAFVKINDQIVVVGGEYQASKLNDVWRATNAQKQAVIGADNGGDNPPDSGDTLGIASDGVLTSQTRIVLIVCGIAAALTCMAALALCLRSRRKAQRKEMDQQREGVEMQQARAASVAAIHAPNARDAPEISLSIEPGQVRVHVSPDDAPGSPAAAAALAAAVGPAVQVNAARRSGSQRHPRQQQGEPTPPVSARGAGDDRDRAPGGRKRSNGGRSRTPSNGAQKSALAAPGAAAAASSSSGGAGGSRPPSRHSSLKSGGAGMLGVVGGGGAAVGPGEAETTPRRASSSDDSARSENDLLSPNHARQHSGSTTGGGSGAGAEGATASSTLQVPAGAAGLPPPSPFLPSMFPPFMLSAPQPAAGAGAGSSAAAAASAAAASAPAPFFVDPSHVAWMQAQMMQYQASLLAAVSAQQFQLQQQQQQQSTPPPSVVRYHNAPAPLSPLPAAAAAAALPSPAPFVAEEWIRSVPQLSAQQSQRVFVPQPLAPFALPPLLLPLPPLAVAPSPSPPLMPLPFAVPSAFAIPSHAAPASAASSAASASDAELQPGAEPPSPAVSSSPSAAAPSASTLSDAGGAGSHAHPPLECAPSRAPHSVFGLHCIHEGRDDGTAD